MNAIGQALTSFGNETRKGLQVAWSEKLQILIELPFFALFILMLGPLLRPGPPGPDRAGALVAEQRPHLILMYFSEPDHEGHQFGPDAADPPGDATVEHRYRRPLRARAAQRPPARRAARQTTPPLARH